MRKGVGFINVEGKLTQIVENEDVIDYPATSCLHDTDWSALRVEMDTEPDALWKKKLIRRTPDWLFDSFKVYIVLTKKPENFEEGNQVSFEVLPTYYELPRIATGTMVVKSDEVDLNMNSGKGDTE